MRHAIGNIRKAFNAYCESQEKYILRIAEDCQMEAMTTLEQEYEAVARTKRIRISGIVAQMRKLGFQNVPDLEQSSQQADKACAVPNGGNVDDAPPEGRIDPSFHSTLADHVETYDKKNTPRTGRWDMFENKNKSKPSANPGHAPSYEEVMQLTHKLKLGPRPDNHTPARTNAKTPHEPPLRSSTPTLSSSEMYQRIIAGNVATAAIAYANAIVFDNTPVMFWGWLQPDAEPNSRPESNA